MDAKNLEKAVENGCIKGYLKLFGIAMAIYGIIIGGGYAIYKIHHWWSYRKALERSGTVKEDSEE